MLTSSSRRPALACLHLTAADVTHLHLTYGEEFSVAADGQVKTWAGFTFTADVPARPDLSGRDHRLDACAAELLRFSPRGGRFVILPLYLHLVDGNRRLPVAYTGDYRHITTQAHVTAPARREGVATTTGLRHTVRQQAQPQHRGSATAAAATTFRPNRPCRRDTHAFDVRQQQQLMALREQLAHAVGGHR